MAFAQVQTDDGGPADSIGAFYRWSPELPMSSNVFDDDRFVVFTGTAPEP